MRRQGLLIYVLVPLIAVSVVGVGLTDARAELNVVGTLEHYGAIAKAIGGDQVKVSALVKGNQNPHVVAVKPSYSVLLNRADLLIANGQLIEVGWLDIALTNARNLKVMEGQRGFLNCSLGVDIIPYTAEEIQGTPFFFLNLGTGGTLRLGNHHYWLDPANNEIIARNILDKLTNVDPANTASYRDNYDRFVVRLREKIKEWDGLMEPYRGTQIVTYHRSWNYLARRYGLRILGYVEPKETLPPSAAYLASLVDQMKRNGVKVILAEPYQSRQVVDEVVRLTGARAVILPSSVSEDLGIHTVVELFDQIYRELAQAFREARAS